VPLAFLLLAASVGIIPVPEVVKRFPDPSYYPGVGVQREAHMLDVIQREVAEELLTRGPGPGQLLARFLANELDGDQRVAVLLGACHYHDPQLLPLYRAAFEEGNVKEKLAAAVGFYQLVGLVPPAPSTIPATGPHWQALAQRARELERATRERPLSTLWARSYLVAIGAGKPQPFAFQAKPEECLEALARIAQPEDLPEVLALWPLARPQDRSRLVRLLEALTLSELVPKPPNPQGPTGPWLMETAVNTVEAFVASLCRTPDGWEGFWRKASELGGGDVKAGLLKVLQHPYPPAWPMAAFHLQGFGAPAVLLDRTRPDNPANKEQVARVRQAFEAKPAEQPRPAAAPLLPVSGLPGPLPKGVPPGPPRMPRPLPVPTPRPR